MTNTADQFNTLIRPHEASLYGAAFHLTRNTSDAEDLVQETMLRAYSRIDTFREDGSVRAWLHTILRNLFINSYRKRSREPQQVTFDAHDDTLRAAPGGSGSSASAGDAHLTPERVVLSRMDEAALLRAVGQLPAEFREVIVLADVQGLAYKEIADRLALPVGTVRSRLNRARKRVRRSLFSWQELPVPATSSRPAASLLPA